MAIRYWQIATGDTSRDVSSVMLAFGVALVGPGRLGPISEETIPKYKHLGEYDKIKPITQILPGDRVVLKRGRSTIVAVGEATGNYSHSSCFHDIDGWDMEHYVPVQWRDIYRENQPLTRATLQRLAVPGVISDIEASWQTAAIISASYPVVESGQPLADHAIEQALINHGLRIEDAENTTRTLARIRKLGEWYRRIKHKASEEEIKAFLVVPFLQALGWSPQRIGLEVNHRDLILYEDSARKRPCVIVEAKRMYEGSASATEQVKNYAKKHTKDPLRHLMVSDGLRYWLLEPDDSGGWRNAAYMNLNNLRPECSAYPQLKGAIELITRLLP